MSHSVDTTSGDTTPIVTNTPLLAMSWLVVGVPLAYGIWQTLVKAAKLFTG